MFIAIVIIVFFTEIIVSHDDAVFVVQNDIDNESNYENVFNNQSNYDLDNKKELSPSLLRSRLLF